MSSPKSYRDKHQRSHSQTTVGPVAHSTPSKSPTKLLRFSDYNSDAKQGVDMTDGASSPPSTRFIFRRDLPSQSSPNRSMLETTEMERDTIIKQRTELQLLIGELKDRDQELNDMVQAHHQQMKSWEEDRQKCITLEQKCSKLERDLNKRNNQIRELLKKLKVIESDAVTTSTALSETQCQLSSAIAEHSSKCQQLKELEAYNNSVQKSYKEISYSLGEAEAKVSQLKKQLELKEKEAVETSKEVTDLASRLKSLEYSYKQLEKITFDVKTSANDWKNKYSDLKQTSDSMKNELDISNATIEEKDDEMDRLRNDLKDKLNEISYADEREKRKDQLLALQKSKQERTDQELSTLRQMYDLQQHKLASMKKELTEIKEKDLRHKTNFNQLNDSNILDVSSLDSSSPGRSNGKLSGSPRHQNTSAKHSINSSEVVTLDLSNHSSTDRLQRLLSDSRKLVQNMTSHESKSPTQLIAQLSMSGDS